MVILCPICGKEFKPRTSQIKKGTCKYCSRKCLGISQLRENNPHWKGGLVIKRCKICEKEFKIYPCHIKKDSRKFCSEKCRDIGHSQEMKGVNNHKWKGGITPDIMKIRSSPESIQWKRNILVRDNFTCRECGQKDIKLHAHHIKKFSVIIDDIRQKYPLFPIVDISKTYPDLWNIKNGITLCIKCHKREHEKYDKN